MTSTHVLDRARTGDASALALLLGEALQTQSIEVTSDRQGDCLNLRFRATGRLNPERLTAFVRQSLRTLQVEPITAVQVFAYRDDEPDPLWSQTIAWPLDSGLPPPETGLQEPEPEKPAEASEVSAQLVDRFIVCGLGSLGQYCVLNLKRFALRAFEIHVTAIDQVTPSEWEIPDLPSLLENELILGDCRDEEVLLRAGIHHCRSVLLVTSNESVNVEAAVVARRLNPQVRLIVRSSRQNLNQLLKQQLGNFIAFEPTELPATAFALAGLGAGILGYFNIGECQLQVVEQVVQPKDFRFDGAIAGSLHKRSYRLLSYHAATSTSTELTAAAASERAFHQWQPETRVRAGDRIAYVEVVGSSPARLPASHAPSLSQIQPESQPSSLLHWLKAMVRGEGRPKISEFWRWMQAQPNRRAIGIGLLVAFCLWALASILLKIYADITWVRAFSLGMILLLGGYGDVFGGIDPEDAVDIPAWVSLFCLLVTLISVLFILGVFGFIADSLLTSRFDFLRRRPPIPKQNHVVIVGFGRIGQRVAMLLRAFRQPVVAITENLENAKLLTQVPLVLGDAATELTKVNLPTAKSLLVLTDDQMLNLEIALMARELARQSKRELGLVIRTYNQRFSDNLSQLLPDAKALAAYALSAEAFAGAAFGENILGLFRLNQRSILVTEYMITAEDTLVGKLLSEITYGYGVVPIFHQKSSQFYIQDAAEFLMPSDDVQLQVGDRLVVLASLNGLRRIEHGERVAPRHWRLEAQQPLNPGGLLDAGSILHRISGCHLDTARNFMNSLPNTLDLPLYDHQAYRLQQELSRYLRVKLTPVAET